MFGTKTNGKVHSKIPNNSLSAIENAIKSLNITEPYHWFRQYYGHIDKGNQIYESLHNNEQWAAGEKMLQKLAWDKSDEFYSIRNFIMLVKHNS